MAAKSERVVKKRKPKVDGGTHRKLGIDQKVEVKSIEDGFLGSWHLGTVIGCDDLFRQVKYDHILSDHDSDNLVEFVSVSPIVDWVTPADEKSVHHLGMNMIRPLPPPREFVRLPLPYGQCVDMFYNDAWWEGVIFDRGEDDEERIIYFPDMGDEMKGRVDKLRVSQDWNEVTEELESRASWIFLEVIEEIEQLYLLLISVKQIWYEVQLKDDSKSLKHWTSSSTDIWRKLVKEVVLDNTNAATLPVDQNFSNLQSVKKRFASAPGTKDDQLCGSGDCSTKSDLPTLANSKPRRKRPPTKKKKFEGRTLVNEPDSCLETSAKYMSSMPSDDIAGILSSIKSGLPTLANSKSRQGRPPTKKKKFERQTLVIKPDSCPEASAKYMSSMPSDDIAGVVEKVAIEGEEKNELMVMGEGIDEVELVTKLRKKVGFADIVSVGPVDKKKEEKPIVPFVYGNYQMPPLQFWEARDPYSYCVW
ncbi:hypothetical protein HAX54_041777 [Datura stramonium]|uniref:Agenet domain-containing protein n=1 Tax=Datura stramonium TaxID=4076 RepID=A0ABS8VXV1_DATST|nr:hypothetical protein [Datura stramonium]